MRDKDQDMLFEVYQQIYEAPISPGESWDEPSTDVAKKFKGLVLPKRKEDVRTLLGKRGLKDEESQIKGIDAMKNFLAQHEGSYYPGGVMEFRSDALERMMAGTGLPKINAGYCVRIIANALVFLNVLSIKDDEIKVQDTEKLNNAEEILDTPVNSPKKDMSATTVTAPSKFNLKATYIVNVAAIDENLPKIERELIDYIQEGMSGEEILYTLKNTILFRNPESTGGLDSNINKLKKMIANWLQSGILKQEEKSEEEHGSNLPELGQSHENPNAAGDYLKDIGANVPTADPYSGEVSSGDW